MVTDPKNQYGLYSRLVLVIVLIAAAWLLLSSSTEVKPVPIKKTLADFPRTIASYHLSNSFQSSSDVVDLLGVDNYIQYNYISTTGERVNLYVGYYRAVGVEGAYHSPQNCIPGGGWGIDTTAIVPLAAGVEGATKSSVSQMTIRRGGEYQIVLYWFQNRGRIIASEYWEKIYLVWDALFQGRRDGAFVRIMTTVEGTDLAAGEKRVRAFAEKVMVELTEYLPGATL